MEKLRSDKQRRVKRTSLATAVAAAAAAIATFGPSPSMMGDLAHNALGKNNAVEREVERIARETYGTTVFAHCAPTKSRGQASPRYHTIRLNPSVCTTLSGIIANPEAINAQDPNSVQAILDVSHELSHVHGAGLGGEHNEGVTHCLAAQRSEQIAEAFGIPPESAKTIGELAATAAMAPPRADYTIPSGCVDGGPYDIDAPGDHFPKDAVQAFLNGD